MIQNNFKNILEVQLSCQIEWIRSVAGGDINDAFFLESKNGNRYFLKINDSVTASDMLSTEAKGLEIIRSSNKIQVPQVVMSGVHDLIAFLVLEFIESGDANLKDWELFAFQLSQLHRSGNGLFGLDHDNFIGRLPQYNLLTTKWVDFYRDQRLIPQLDIMKDLFPSEDEFFKASDALLKILPEIVEDAEPSLIHGDLWGGNYLSSKENGIYLIDPAVSIASREMDIAMSKLFGGFPTIFYDAYHSSYPLHPGWEARIPLYQLYYLLAHVNMFGRSYLAGARRAIENYVS